MEHIINLHVEKLPEGIYLATCDDIQGLVAQGRTNREVAAALDVSVRTVESNLSRVYVKLGIRSRSELARLLAAS